MKKIIILTTIAVSIVTAMVNAQTCQPLNIVYCGDSNFDVYPVYSVWQQGAETPCSKTTKILRGYGYSVSDTNLAKSGNTIYSIQSQVNDIERFAKKSTTNILVANGFHNSAGTNNMKGELIAQMFFDISKIAKSKGFDKVFILTAHCTDFQSPSYPYYAYDSIETKRKIFNKIICDSAIVRGYEVIHIANDTRFNYRAYVSDLRYYMSDGLHLNGYTGSQLYADIMSRYVDNALCKKAQTTTYTGESEAIDASVFKVFPNPTDTDEIFIENTEGVQRVDVKDKPKGLNFIIVKNKIIKFVKL